MVSSFIPIVYVHHPVPLRELLTLNLPKERKYVYRFLEAFTGETTVFHLVDHIICCQIARPCEGLIVASQPKWGKRRKLLGRAFHRKSVDMFVEKIGSCCETFVGRLIESQGKVVNATHYCEVMTLDILLKCTFCLDNNWQDNKAISRFVEVVAMCVHHVTTRIYNPLYFLDAIYFRTPAGREFRKLVKEAQQFTTDIIELSRKRSQADGTNNDIVSQVYEEMGVSDEISVEDLASEVTTLLFAGMRGYVSRKVSMLPSQIFSFLCSYYLLAACALVYVIAFNTLLSSPTNPGNEGSLIGALNHKEEFIVILRSVFRFISRHRFLIFLSMGCLAARHVFLLVWVKTQNGYIESVVPGPRGWPLFGNTLQAVPIKPAGLRKFHSWSAEFPVMFKYMVSSFIPIVYVHHPVPLRELLTLNLPKERKYVYRFLEAFTGEGLIVASQPKWGKRRKLLGRAFHRKSVDMFVEKIGSCCETFVGRLIDSQGKVVNAAHYCEVMTLDILLKCTFCLDDNWQDNKAISRFVEVVAMCVHHVTTRIYNPLYFLDAIYFRTPAGREFRKLVKEAQQFTTDIIELSRKRSQADGTNNDIVSQVYEEMGVSDEISVEDLASEVTTLLFAGHDTSAHGVTFALALLSQHKYCWRKCKEEVMAFKGRSDFMLGRARGHLF
eukprot:sb/3462772/